MEKAGMLSMQLGSSLKRHSASQGFASGSREKCLVRRPVMKKLICLSVVLGMLLLSTSAFSDDGKLLLKAHYNLPLNSEEMGETLDFEAGFRFWGIFVLSASMHTQIIYGADNIFNISKIAPIGLASAGFGLQIPLGGIDLIMDWQQFFTIIGTTNNFRLFSGSFKFGGVFNIGESWGIEVYNRKLSNFSADSGILADQINLLGVGAVFALF
jgi:hypothetical protein